MESVPNGGSVTLGKRDTCVANVNQKFSVIFINTFLVVAVKIAKCSHLAVLEMVRPLLSNPLLLNC